MSKGKGKEEGGRRKEEGEGGGKEETEVRNRKRNKRGGQRRKDPLFFLSLPKSHPCHHSISFFPKSFPPIQKIEGKMKEKKIQKF